MATLCGFKKKKRVLVWRAHQDLRLACTLGDGHKSFGNNVWDWPANVVMRDFPVL
jgi:hypothetical protein